MIPGNEQLKTGRYIVSGKAANCTVRERDVQIHYDNGSYTCMSHHNFRYSAEPIQESAGYKDNART